MIASGTTVGSIGILTQGASGLDFADGGGSTCTAKTYSSATNCVVNVKFTPRVAGTRNGAVVFHDGSGNALSTTYIYGTGTGNALWRDRFIRQHAYGAGDGLPDRHGHWAAGGLLSGCAEHGGRYWDISVFFGYSLWHGRR